MTVHDAGDEHITAQEVADLRAENDRLRGELMKLAQLVVRQGAEQEARLRNRRRSDMPTQEDTYSRPMPPDA